MEVGLDYLHRRKHDVKRINKHSSLFGGYKLGVLIFIETFVGSNLFTDNLSIIEE